MSTPPPSSRLERLGGFLQADPDNTRLLRDYAVEAVAAGEHRAAVVALQRLVALDASQLDDHLVLAQALRRDGGVRDALAVLSDAAARWPGDPWVALETARCLFSERAFEQALGVLVDAPGDDPAAAEIPALRIRLLHHLGRVQEAESLADAHLAAGRGVDAVTRAALPVLLDQSRLEEAVALAAALMENVPAGRPTPYEACEPFAAAALDEGDPQAARQWTVAALQQRQDDGRIWLLDGLARLAGEGPALALDSLERAAGLMPGHAGSHLALGWACIAANDWGRASAAFEAGVAADPGFAEGHGSLAVLAAMQQRRPAAEELLRKATRLDAACASALLARQLLDGRASAADMPRLAERVIAQARRSLRSRAANPHLS